MKPNPARKNPDRQSALGKSVSSGFPSPAEDYEEPPLDLHDLAVATPLATYFLRADTDQMQNDGIQSGDLLVVDRSLDPIDSQIVLAEINEVLQIKRYRNCSSGVLLEDDVQEIPADRSAIWGVVTFILRKM